MTTSLEPSRGRTTPPHWSIFVSPLTGPPTELLSGGLLGLVHGLVGLVHGLVGLVHGLVGFAHGLVGFVHGFVGLAHGLLGLVHGFVGLVHGLLELVQLLGGVQVAVTTQRAHMPETDTLSVSLLCTRPLASPEQTRLQ